MEKVIAIVAICTFIIACLCLAACLIYLVLALYGLVFIQRNEGN